MLSLMKTILTYMEDRMQLELGHLGGESVAGNNRTELHLRDVFHVVVSGLTGDNH